MCAILLTMQRRVKKIPTTESDFFSSTGLGNLRVFGSSDDTQRDGASKIMKPKIRSVAGLAGAGFFGAVLTLALGSEKPRPTTSPRYTVQVWATVMHITDNETNKLYIYENQPSGSKLLGSVDLAQTGRAELIGTKPGGDR